MSVPLSGLPRYAYSNDCSESPYPNPIGFNVFVNPSDITPQGAAIVISYEVARGYRIILTDAVKHPVFWLTGWRSTFIHQFITIVPKARLGVTNRSGYDNIYIYHIGTQANA
jgi:hypothetical protein